MNKEIDSYDVSCELAQIKHLLFFMGESFENIRDSANDYRQLKAGSDKMLAHETNRCIDQLQALESVLLDKVMNLEKKFE